MEGMTAATTPMGSAISDHARAPCPRAGRPRSAGGGCRRRRPPRQKRFLRVLSATLPKPVSSWARRASRSASARAAAAMASTTAVHLLLGEAGERSLGCLARARRALAPPGSSAGRRRVSPWRDVGGARPSSVPGPRGRIFSTSAWGRGITWTLTSSPTRRAAAAPASVAAFTAPTSPRTMHGHVARADVLLAHEHDVRGLDHGVGGLDRADEALRLDHPERFHRHRPSRSTPLVVSDVSRREYSLRSRRGQRPDATRR